MEQLVHRALQEAVAPLADPEIPDHREDLDLPAVTVILDLKDRAAIQAPLEVEDQRDPKDPVDDPEMLDQLEPQEEKVSMDTQEDLDLLDQLDQLATPVILDPLEDPEVPADLDPMVPIALAHDELAEPLPLQKPRKLSIS